MGTFDRYSNFDKQANFTGVTFGEANPVLEVELNELQQIQNEARKDLIKDLIDGGVINDPNISYNGTALELSEEAIVYLNGSRFVIPKSYTMDIPSTPTQLVFLEAWYKDVSFGDTLTVNGGEGQPVVTNNIKDNRYPAETTRRLVLRWRLRSTSDLTLVATPIKGNLDTPSLVNFTKKTDNLYLGEVSGASFDGVVYAIPLVLVSDTTVEKVYNKVWTDSDHKKNLGVTTENLKIGMDNSMVSINKNAPESFATIEDINGVTLQNELPRLTFFDTTKTYSTASTSNVELIKQDVNVTRLRPNTVYTLVYNLKFINKTLTGFYFQGNYRNTSGVSKSLWSQALTTYTSGSEVKALLTTPDDIEILLFTFLGGKEGSVSILTGGYCMILEGDWTNKEIPPYFEGIRSVGESGENLELISCGKNLFNNDTTLIKKGVYFSATGEYTSEINSVLSEFYIKVDNTRKYVWNGTNKSIIIATYDSNKNFIERLIMYGGTIVNSTKFNDNVKYVRIASYQSGVETLNNFHLEEGIVLSTYEPYKEHRQPITLTEPFKGLSKDVKDTVDFERDVVVKNVGKSVFDGSVDEVWTSGSNDLTNTMRFQITVPNASSTYTDLVSNFPVLKTSTYGYDFENIQITTNSVLLIRILKSKLTTPDAQGFKTYLQTNPITVYHPLLIPVEEPIKVEPYMKQFKEGHIYINGSLIIPEVNINSPISLGSSVDTLVKKSQQDMEDLSVLVTPSSDGLMLSTDKTKLDGIEEGANKYTHPSTHGASMITQDSTHRFVTDTEKTTWNNKANTTLATTTTNGLMSSADKTKLDNSYIKTEVDNAISTAVNNLINGSPGALDTLLELATAMGNDPNFATTVTNSLATKVDKITGKGLSAEDFTTALLTKLNGISTGAEVNQNAVQSLQAVTSGGVAIGTATATGKTDTIQLKEGSNIDITVSGKVLTINNTYSYTHPDSHLATMITQDATHRFVTDTEKSTWNGKANTTVATTGANGLMSSADKTKLDGIATGANNYTHPTTHSATMITEDTTHRFVTDTEKSTWNGKAGTSIATTTANGLMSSSDKVKLNGVETGANKYTHPPTHEATMIVEDTTHRFVTDDEKTAWNGMGSLVPNSNLLRNSSAEYGTWGDTSEWYATTSAGEGGQYFSAIARTGKWSFKLMGSTSTFKGAMHTRKDILSYLVLKPNTKYVLSAYVKLKNVVGYGAYIQYEKVDGSYAVHKIFSQPITGTREWERISVEFTTTSAIADFEMVSLILDGTGEAFFDDIKLEEKNLSPWSISEFDLLCVNGIVESGSNTNGRYVKFADGTMICSHIFGSIKVTNSVGQGYVSPVQTWTLPAVFVETPPRILATANNFALASGGTNSLSSATFNLLSYDINRIGGAQLFAIGRWK